MNRSSPLPLGQFILKPSSLTCSLNTSPGAGPCLPKRFAPAFPRPPLLSLSGSTSSPTCAWPLSAPRKPPQERCPLPQPPAAGAPPSASPQLRRSSSSGCGNCSGGRVFHPRTPRTAPPGAAPGPSMPSSAPRTPFRPAPRQGLPLTLLDVAVAAPRDGHVELALRLGQAAQAEGVQTGQQLGLRLTPALQALLTHGAGVQERGWRS